VAVYKYECGVIGGAARVSWWGWWGFTARSGMADRPVTPRLFVFVLTSSSLKLLTL